MKSYVLFDASRKGSVKIRIFAEDGAVLSYEEGAQGDAMAAFDGALGRAGLSLRDVGGAAVAVGAGTFTDTRRAAVVANALSLALRIPVAGARAEHCNDLVNLAARLSVSTVGTYFSPAYSGEPNIGKEHMRL